jgi:hypothetical protein
MSLWRGRKTGRDPCRFCEAGTHRVSGSNRLAGVYFLQGVEEVKERVCSAWQGDLNQLAFAVSFCCRRIGRKSLVVCGN